MRRFFLDPRNAALGAAGNFLRLLREASLDGADFVALADQDDIWLPTRLARAAALLREGKLDAYSSDVAAFWDSDQCDRVTIRNQFERRIFAIRSRVREDAHAD